MLKRTAPGTARAISEFSVKGPLDDNFPSKMHQLTGDYELDRELIDADNQHRLSVSSVGQGSGVSSGVFKNCASDPHGRTSCFQDYVCIVST